MKLQDGKRKKRFLGKKREKKRLRKEERKGKENKEKPNLKENGMRKVQKKKKGGIGELLFSLYF
jgi:hypothetical protein